jgi:hypothetical protein
MNAPWWRLADGSTRVEEEDVDDDLLPPFYD